RCMPSHKILRECLKRSLATMDKHPQYKHYIHYSYAIVDGKIVCVGLNKQETPPLHYGYHDKVSEPKIHSELDAYRKLRKRVRINQTDWELVNVRLNRSGEIKISKPCRVCEA